MTKASIVGPCRQVRAASVNRAEREDNARARRPGRRNSRSIPSNAAGDAAVLWGRRPVSTLLIEAAWRNARVQCAGLKSAGCLSEIIT
jgi:hypothetical protein